MPADWCLSVPCAKCGASSVRIRVQRRVGWAAQVQGRAAMHLREFSAGEKVREKKTKNKPQNCHIPPHAQAEAAGGGWPPQAADSRAIAIPVLPKYPKEYAVGLGFRGLGFRVRIHGLGFMAWGRIPKMVAFNPQNNEYVGCFSGFGRWTYMF